MSKEKTLKKELGILAGIRNCLKSKESVNEITFRFDNYYMIEHLEPSTIEIYHFSTI